MKLNDSDVLKRLKILFEKHARQQATPESQMLFFWSTSNPPDILENTRSLTAIELEFDIFFTEIEAVTIYDMNLLDASNYIEKIIVESNDYELNNKLQPSL